MRMLSLRVTRGDDGGARDVLVIVPMTVVVAMIMPVVMVMIMRHLKTTDTGTERVAMRSRPHSIQLTHPALRHGGDGFLDGADLGLETQHIGAVFAHDAGCGRHFGKGRVTDTTARGLQRRVQMADMGVAHPQATGFASGRRMFRN